MSNTTPMIISADDYAQSAAIDAGILSLIQMGRITAASCLTLSPRWPEAAKLITKEIQSCADIGLHLDFTQYPQSARFSLPMLIMRTLSHTLNTDAVRASINNQLDRFEDALGKAPDYIDGHQHVHQLPQIRDALLDIVIQRYSARLPWIRIARPPLHDGLKAFVIGVLGANSLARKARKVGLPGNEKLLGVYDFNGDAAGYQHKLSAWLSIAHAASGDGISAFMCHPAMPAQSANAGADDPIYSARLREYQIFAGGNFLPLLAHYSIKPARGNVLQAAKKQA